MARSLRLPPLPSDITKIISAAKHLFFACLLVLIGVLAGRRLISFIGVGRPNYQPGDRWLIVQDLILALGMGWGLLIYLIFFLGVAGGLYAVIVWCLIFVLIVVSLPEIPALYSSMRILLLHRTSARTTSAEQAGVIVVAIVLLLQLIIALSPTIPHDAMVYHLNVPRIYADAHRIIAIPYNSFSNMFLNLEMLYLTALLIDDYILANLIHYSLGFAIVMFIYGFTTRNFGQTTAVIATFLFLFNPVVFGEMPMTWIDLGVAFYFMLAIYCLWRWKTEGKECWFVLACIFTGIFAATKYTSTHGLISICSVIAAAELLSPRRHVRTAVKRLMLLGGVVILFVLPYLVKNLLITGNPVYPIFYNIFGGRWLTPDQAKKIPLIMMNNYGMGRDVWSLVALPWNITMHYRNFGGTLTPLWLIFLPAFVFIKPKPAILKWATLICAVYFVTWAANFQHTRYLIPLFPLLSIICAWAITAINDKFKLVSRPLSFTFKSFAILVCGIVWLSFAYWYLLPIPSKFGPVVWGTQKPNDFLRKTIPNYPVFEFINERLPEEAQLRFFFENRGFFCDRPYIGDAVSLPSSLELFREAESPAAVRRRLAEMGITHILVNWPKYKKHRSMKISEEDEARLEKDLNKKFMSFSAKYCVPLFSADGVVVYVLRG